MSARILFVDDEPNILSSFRRQLHKAYALQTATSGMEGLERIQQEGDFAVVVSDLRMPGMDGVEFLTRVRERSPDTVRMILTGNADLQAAISAVNDGCIFRFLTKPCPVDILSRHLEIGLEQYRLITAEKELLEKTLHGSIRVLTEILEMVNPEAFGRSARIKQLAGAMAREMKSADVWRVETAAMLSQIGCIILPPEVLQKLYRSEAFTDEEVQLFAQHPMVAAELIERIPRMGEVAGMIELQDLNYDGSGMPSNALVGEQIPLGARILKVALDFDVLKNAGSSATEALAEMKDCSGRYDPQLLQALERLTLGAAAGNRQLTSQRIKVVQIEEKMIIDEDVINQRGNLIIAKGHEVSRPLMQRLKNFARSGLIPEHIRVLVRP